MWHERHNMLFWTTKAFHMQMKLTTSFWIQTKGIKNAFQISGSPHPLVALTSRINNHLFLIQKIFFNLLYRTMNGMFYQIVRLLWNISKIFFAASHMENKDQFGENIKIALSGMSGIVRHVFGYFTTASMNCDSSMSDGRMWISGIS